VRFLLKADIGMIPDTLANVHTREHERLLCKSPIARDAHEENTLFCNRTLREDINNHRMAAAGYWCLVPCAARTEHAATSSISPGKL